MEGETGRRGDLLSWKPREDGEFPRRGSAVLLVPGLSHDLWCFFSSLD